METMSEHDGEMVRPRNGIGREKTKQLLLLLLKSVERKKNKKMNTIMKIK